MIKDDIFDPIHLQIAFHSIQPEVLLQNIRKTANIANDNLYLRVTNDRWDEKAYVHYAMANDGLNRTDDEAKYLYAHWVDRMKHPGRADSVFEALRRYAQILLTMNDETPVCHYENILRWRVLSLSLGQDLFTTSYLAAGDIKFRKKRNNFAWPAVIGTDNKRLALLVSQGVSENHFHLNGSTRMFSLSWICMMNHPNRIRSFFADKSVKKEFSERLNLGITGSPEEKLMPWDRLILYAAYVRALLFSRLAGDITSEQVDEKFFTDFDLHVEDKSARVKDIVGKLRYNYGARIPQQNREEKILDYALTLEMDCCVESHNRLLAGERNFLYLCFRACYGCEFSNLEKDLFYFYLLIKNQFRSEMIQVNRRIGFQNFARYQDRKGMFWEMVPEYWDESIRLAVNATLHSGSIRSLEARMGPAKTAIDQYKRIANTDRAYGYAATGKPLNKQQLEQIADSPLFYVLHFPKNRKEVYKVGKSSTSELTAYFYPRNSSVRKASEIQARAVAKALKQSPYLRKRIRGIDACSNEVGCRPETFATEFRFLRSGIPCSNSALHNAGNNEEIHVSATYHAGEDFIDIIDGIRAIDEAYLFLEFNHGDRLGHALALGIKPADYYRVKNYKLAIPKQDLLDNLVWILFKTLELDVNMPSGLRTRIENEVNRLMDDVGYSTNRFSMQEYYQSWRLRGDHPRVYQYSAHCDQYFLCGDRINCDTCPNRLETENATPFRYMLQGSYESFYEQESSELGNYRGKKTIQELCAMYHYDYEIKKAGEKIVAYQIERQLIPVVEKLQNQMQHFLMKNGIAIECNPSSNLLIGSFGEYRDHPLFRFNRHRISVPQWVHEEPANLCVSINTDDQGVFDTSLEAEYAYIACAMERELDGDGNRINTDDEIFDYLDHIRILGNSQTFHYKGKEIFFNETHV